MEIKLIILNNEKYYDLTNLCEGEILLTSTIGNSPASLKFKLTSGALTDKNINFEEGNEILLYVNGKGVFKGYIFQKQRTKEQLTDIFAYDQTRYLKNKDSFFLKDLTASQIIKNICGRFKINMGEIDETNYIIPNLISENETLWHTFENALKLTEEETKEKYIIYDDFGKLTLKNVKKLSVPLFFSSDDKTMIDFNYKTDIDGNTFNKIKLFKHNEDNKTCYTAAEAEGESINKWGVLQYTEVIDNDMNTAQAKELAKKILEAKNKINPTLSVVDFGNINIRAGVTIGVKIKDIGQTLNSLFYVKECIHTFKNNQHTMRLELTENYNG